MSKEIKEIFTKLVKEHTNGMVSWTLFKVNNKSIAEDLVQDTFLAAFSSYSTFQNKSNIKTWLYSILNNKINDHFRKLKSRPELTNIQEYSIEKYFDENGNWKSNSMPQIWNSEDNNILDDFEFRKLLIDCINNLPTKFKNTVIMKYIDDKSSKEICNELTITPTNLWQIVHRSKLQLRQCLEINWFGN